MAADPIDVDAIEARCKAAEAGPWQYDAVVDTIESAATLRTVARDVGDGATATFILHAREDVPALLAEIRRLRAAAAE